KGLSANAHDARGYPLLVLATTNQQYTCMQLLLDNKADVNLTTASGNTAIHFACYKADEKSIKLLQQYGATLAYCSSIRSNPLLALLCNDDNSTSKTIALLKMLNPNKETLAEKDIDGRTVLHHATKWVDAVDLLIKEILALGAPINETDQEGNTALHH